MPKLVQGQKHKWHTGDALRLFWSPRYSYCRHCHRCIAASAIRSDRQRCCVYPDGGAFPCVGAIDTRYCAAGIRRTSAPYFLLSPRVPPPRPTRQTAPRRRRSRARSARPPQGVHGRRSGATIGGRSGVRTRSPASAPCRGWRSAPESLATRPGAPAGAGGPDRGSARARRCARSQARARGL